MFRRHRHVLLACLLFLVIALPRGAWIVHAHSVTYDEPYHLTRGLWLLEGDTFPTRHNDPPFGEVLLALPIKLTGGDTRGPQRYFTTKELELSQQQAVLLGQPLGEQTLRQIIAVWKALLFLPAVAVAFVWCRQLFGLSGAWLCIALLLSEPTLAAMLPIATLDSLAAGVVLVAAYFIWQWSLRFTWRGAVTAAIALAVAITTKHTAILCIGLVPIFAAINLRGVGVIDRITYCVRVFLMAVLFIWPLTIFNISMPSITGSNVGTIYDEHWRIGSHLINPLLGEVIPAGVYIGSLAEWFEHIRQGHPGYLLGEIRLHGWWYYFPFVSLYKVPIAMLVCMLMALILPLSRYARKDWMRARATESHSTEADAGVRPTHPIQRAELGLIILAALLGLSLLSSPIDIGFRHALPLMVIALLLTSRIAVWPRARALAWLAVLAIQLQMWLVMPNLLSFISIPDPNTWRRISDSNIDWGQAERQARAWVNANHPAQPVYLAYFGFADATDIVNELGDIVLLDPTQPLPTHGTLITSPVFAVGLYGAHADYRRLAEGEPVDVIGQALLVFALDGAQ